MNDNFVPKISCRYRIRKDINGYVGFFERNGILILNEISAFIVLHMDGERNLRDIGDLLRKKFPKIKDPIGEVRSIATELMECNFFT